MLGNRLAEPGLLGINHGAAFAVVLFTLLSPGWAGDHTALLAGCAALFSMGLIYWLAGGAGATRESLILVGLAFAALTSAGTSIAIAVGESQEIIRVLAWLTGSFHGASWDRVHFLIYAIPALLAVAFSRAYSLDILELGPLHAHALGCPVVIERVLLLALAALLAAAAVSIAGALGFVGLIAPHLARMVTGTRHRQLIPLAAVIGGGLTLLADTVGRLAMPPFEIPAGIPLALTGVPLFLVLFRRIN